MVLVLLLLVAGLFSGRLSATVVFDNYVGQDNVPANPPSPNYQNYAPRSDPNYSVDQLQNLINLAGGGTGNIASSGTSPNIDWAQSSYTLCDNTVANYATAEASCAAWLQGRVTYALVKFPAAGMYSFAVSHDDETQVGFASQFTAANAANYRNFNYNVPVGSLTSYTAGDTTFQSLPGNFQIPQANTCYVMRVYWNNQQGKNDLHLEWTVPGGTATIIPASALSDPSVASNYSGCATAAQDFGIAKTGPVTFVPGTAITYTITVWNYSGGDATAAHFSDTLPASLSKITFTCAASGSAVCGSSTNSGNAYAVTTGALPVNSSAGNANTPPTTGSFLTYTVRATPSDVATIVNTATITDNDTNDANDSGTTTSTAASHNNTLTKVWSGATAGDTVNLSITGTGVTSATAGKSTAPSTTTAASAAANINTTINLVEAFTTGNAAQYATTLACVKNTDGTAVTVAGTGLNRSVTVPSDSGVKCTYTNKLATSVAVTKTGPATATTGSSYSYTLNVANSGSAATGTNVIVQDQLPAGEVATASTNATCTPLNSAAALLTCTIPGPIAAAGSVSVGLTVTAPAAAGAITNYAAANPAGTGNPASPPGATCSTSTTSCSSAATTVQAPVLTLTKTHAGNFTVGASGAYTLTVSNSGAAGTGPTSGTVTVSDTLPTGLTFVSATGTGWTCSAAGQVVTCTSTTPIAAGASAQAITLTVDVAASAAPSVTNAANVSGGGDSTCPATARCAPSDPTTVNTAAKVSVSKTGPATAVAGASYAYMLAVANGGGTATSTNVIVQDQLPAGEVATASTGATCAPLNSAGALVTCTIATAIAANGSTSIGLVVTAPTAGGSITNYAATNPAGKGTNPPSAPGAACNTSTTSCSSAVTTVQAPVLNLSKTHTGNFSVSTNGTYTLTASNSGNAATTAAVTVTDTLPAGLSYVSATGTGWSCSATGQAVTCTSTTAIAANASAAPITLTVGVAAAAIPSATNTAVVSGGGDNSCPAASHCDASDATTVGGTASLTLAKTSSVADTNADSVVGDPGDTITYAFSVTNTGTLALSNVKVTDPRLPSLGCTLATLAAGATASCAATNNTYVITANDVASGKVSNTATATGTPPGGVTAPTASSTVNTTTAAPPSTSVTLSQTATVTDTNSDGVSGDTGDVITYAFSAKNTGTVTLTNVKVTDPLLPNLSCTIASLAANATASCTATGNTYTITASDVTAGKVTSTATVTGTPPGTLTPPTATNTVTTPTSATPTASFTVKPTGTVADSNGDGTIGDAGDVITYAFSVTNTGTTALTSVVVTDPRLPNLVCTIASLPVGATASCTPSNNTYTITAQDVTSGSVSDTANATATAPTGLPPPTATGTTSNPTAATPTTSVTLSQTATVTDTNSDGVSGDTGDMITYAFSAKNTGTVTLTNVKVTDPLLPNLSCTIASLAANATASCTATGNTYTITASDVTAGKVTSTATVTGTPPGTLTPPTATNTVTTPTAATPTASFTVKPTGTVADSNGDGTIGDVGDVITYAFSVTNTGTTALTSVVVTDPRLPNLVCTIASLPVGATASCTPSNNTYTITAQDVTSGSVSDTANATATAPTGLPPPTATSTTSNPTAATPTTSVTLSQTATVTDTNSDGVSGDAGDMITYAFSAKNTGTVTLTNVKVTDPLLPNLSCTIASLAANATASCTATGNTYTITASDVTAGKVTSTATVTGTPPGTLTPPTATNTVTTPTAATPTASFTVKPTGTVADSNGDGTIGDVGDVITYAFSVTNTGTTALTSVVVTDPRLPNLVCTIASLPVGATASCTPSNNTYTITAQDVTSGSVSDTANATATAPTGLPPPTATGTTSNPTAATPTTSVTLSQTATVADTNNDGVSGDAGDVITYAFSVTNTGTTALTNVVVTDPRLPNLMCTIATLQAGATASCDATGNTYAITAADASAGKVDDTATVSGRPPGSLAVSTASASTRTITKAGNGAVTLTKQAAQRDVNVGDLVRYTVVATASGNAAVRDVTLIDTPPAGFSYVQNSLSVVDADKSGTLSGTNPIRVTGIDIAAGSYATITYFLRVGAGVGTGVHTNQAVVDDASGKTLSNVASAEVELTSDPLLDDSLIVGTVFDDRDGDGWQDPAKASKVHVQGGFAPDVYMANSTTVDKGHGPQPEADHSAPLLHGLSLGTIGGRSSTADSAERHQVVISQRLRDLRFTDDFVLTTGEGSTLRMNAAGQTTIERTGDARKGLTGQDIAVQRQVRQADGGYQVDYIIRDNGVEERGIPGVRVVSVEGLVMETDAYGRFNLQGIDGGEWARGRNFILKVDPSTLPPGSAFTTENPRVIRITPGVPVRFDFGVKLPSGEIEGGHAETDIALGEVLFAAGSAEVKPNYESVLDTIVGKIRQFNGGSVTITATAEQQALAYARARAVQQALDKRLDPATRDRLKVNVTVLGDSSPLVSLGQSVHLGTVLFDTDQASIKPAYRTLLASIAKTLDAQGGGVVTLVGRADHRGTDAYNTQLGLERARAVYAALVADLKPEVKARVRVEVSDNPNAPLGLDKR